MEMQSYTSPNPVGYGAEFDSGAQYVPNHFCDSAHSKQVRAIA